MRVGRLAVDALLRTLAMLLVMALLIFLPAGTWQYWQAWVFCGTFFSATLVVSLYFLFRDPDFIRRRLKWREPERRQQIGQSILGFFFLFGLVLAGLDHRYGWSHVPVALVLLGDAGILMSFFFIARVFQANPFAASTVEVESGQQVITTGPYAIVRHPMYLGALPLFLSIPLALGSYWALLAYAPCIVGIILRILNEEAVLLRDLPGYADYTRTVRWRLIPHVW